MGGTGSDHGTDLVIDGLDRTVVVGYTESADFPTVAPLQPAIAGSFDAVVTRLAPSGAIVQSTFHGGSSLDRAYSVTVDAADQVVIGGVTLSTDLPLAPGAGYHQGTYATNGDGFVSLLDAAMGSLVRSTYVGGTAGHGEDGVHGVAVNPLGLYAGGYGHSNDFPTTAGAFQSVAADPQPGFAMWLNH